MGTDAMNEGQKNFIEIDYVKQLSIKSQNLALESPKTLTFASKPKFSVAICNI